MGGPNVLRIGSGKYACPLRFPTNTTKQIYNQRTAVERPHFHNGAAIANFNTLIYILINLRCDATHPAQPLRGRQLTRTHRPAKRNQSNHFPAD